LSAPENQKKSTKSGEPSGEIAGPAAAAGTESLRSEGTGSLPLKIMSLLFIVFLIALFDQATKALIVQRMYLYDSIPVMPGIFSITRIHNSGIAFGLFPGMPDVFKVVTAISVLIVFYFFLSTKPQTLLLTASCGLIMGGAVGNLIDRFRLGYVVDFIHFSFWPAFNVADSAVTVGVTLLMISFFLAERNLNASDTA
jgi:signal peptidase II